MTISPMPIRLSMIYEKVEVLIPFFEIKIVEDVDLLDSGIKLV